MRKFLGIVFLLIVGAALWLAWAIYDPVHPPTNTFVLLHPGWSTKRIAAKLKSSGVIRSQRAFLLLHYLQPGSSLKAGEYKFDSPANSLQIRERIARGDIYTHTVVIPEGYNIYDIAQVMQNASLCTKDEFLKAAADNVSLITGLDPEAKTLEGYLFPDTYQFTRTQNLPEMISVMVRRFEDESKKLGLNTNVRRTVTMASIIEKETRVPEERPLVASVYYNRLAKNMAFAADPTVIYAALLAQKWDGTINQSDLQFDSPYNTYKHSGLPPGPIANPGVESLRAAMHPTQTNYYYFVADAQGRNNFSNSYDQHVRNVAAYRRALGGK